MLVFLSLSLRFVLCTSVFVFFQAEDGIRDLVRSRGLGDVYKRQFASLAPPATTRQARRTTKSPSYSVSATRAVLSWTCLLYTSDAADERSSVDLGGRRIIKKTKRQSLARRYSIA